VYAVQIAPALDSGANKSRQLALTAILSVKG
jgi:hypothetical protein